jgi:hypothetical protein
MMYPYMPPIIMGYGMPLDLSWDRVDGASSVEKDQKAIETESEETRTKEI